MSPSRFRIPAHVFVFGLASVPGVFYALYWQKNHKSDEEFEAMLKQNYGHNIDKSKDRRTDMVRVLDSMKKNDESQQQKFAEVLQGGRGQVKRYSAIDAKLYGTAKGLEMREEHEQQQQQQQDNKETAVKKEKKEKVDSKKEKGNKKSAKKSKSNSSKKEKDKISENQFKDNVPAAVLNPSDEKINRNTIASGTILLATVAITGFIFGSKGNKS